MKAIVYAKHGSSGVLEHRDTDKPSVTDDGVLVRVRGGAVETVGKDATRFHPERGRQG